jgi:hypothetical protein
VSTIKNSFMGSRLSRRVQEEEDLRWRWKDQGKGKRGGNSRSREAFHKRSIQGKMEGLQMK